MSPPGVHHMVPHQEVALCLSNLALLPPEMWDPYQAHAQFEMTGQGARRGDHQRWIPRPQAQLAAGSESSRYQDHPDFCDTINQPAYASPCAHLVHHRSHLCLVF